MNKYYVVDYSYGEISGIFATPEEAIARAKLRHDELKADYVVEYREEIFCTKPPFVRTDD